MHNVFEERGNINVHRLVYHSYYKFTKLGTSFRVNNVPGRVIHATISPSLGHPLVKGE